jgi:hypothetical protein
MSTSGERRSEALKHRAAQSLVTVKHVLQVGGMKMSQQGQWQVAGSAPEVYERELVPAVFGVWAPC